MTTDEIRKILDKLMKDPKAEELLKEYDKSKDRSAVYAEIAKKLGYELSEADLKDYIGQCEKAVKSQTKASIETIEQLSDEDMIKVAGGGDKSTCLYTYKDRENCWWNDGCDTFYTLYEYYKCHLSNH